jgi:hypothetical protein
LFLDAVIQRGWALEHVPVGRRALALCVEAVSRRGMALEHAPSALRGRVIAAALGRERSA